MPFQHVNDAVRNTDKRRTNLEKHGIDFEQAFWRSRSKMSTAQLFRLIQLARTEIYRKGKDQTCVRRTLENHIHLAGYPKLERQRFASEILSKAIETV